MAKIRGDPFAPKGDIARVVEALRRFALGREMGISSASACGRRRERANDQPPAVGLNRWLAVTTILAPRVVMVFPVLNDARETFAQRP